MPKLIYTATGFPKSSPPALSGINTLSFSWSELVWAAISVGRAGMSHILQFGIYSTFEIIYRAALVYANLRETPAENLTRSEAYNALDPSEKGAISYFLGLTLSKLFAERCIQVPWLLHLDVYRAQLNPVMKRGRSKPDLVGRDVNGNWVVIESKGRTNEFDSAALKKAKTQSRKVRTICGTSPVLRMGVQSYFESSELCLAVVDPKGADGKGLPDLPITPEMITQEYYRPLRAWLEQAGQIERVTIEDSEFFVRIEPELELAVGLDAEHYRGGSGADSPRREMREGRIFQDRFVGIDGVLVALGPRWTGESMKEEPEHRSK